MIFITNIRPLESTDREDFFEVTLDISGTIKTFNIKREPLKIGDHDTYLYNPADASLGVALGGPTRSHSHVVHAVAKWCAGQIDLPYMIEWHLEPQLVHRLAGLLHGFQQFRDNHLSIEFLGSTFSCGTIKWMDMFSPCEAEFRSLEEALSLLRQWVPSNYGPEDEKNRDSG